MYATHPPTPAAAAVALWAPSAAELANLSEVVKFNYKKSMTWLASGTRVMDDCERRERAAALRGRLAARQASLDEVDLSALEDEARQADWVDMRQGSI